ncbi:MAG: glycosyltransferase family 2 protein [candidate division KSB1 bacterium]|nr:glycosyltransferase family 2 protein [candidate division KSB1 bacterium]
MDVLFWAGIALIVYVYAGYPLLLLLLNSVRGGRAVRRANIEPDVTLIISAYNEEDVIVRKLDNSLHLDYPAKKLEILVVSDASTDKTDDIVRQYADRGVRLLRMPERGGKTVGLNAAVPQARGEIIIFSDANALYDRKVVRNMVRNFADPEVGVVTGESRYLIEDGDTSTESENLYWRYELMLKKLESALGSVVGGDGAIYAIRKSLYRPMQPSDLSDFVNPLQIVAQGYRNVYEPEAFSYEKGGESFEKEFRRKVRIVNRAWRGMVSMRRVLNPFRYGWFAVQAWSHKVLRWWVPAFMAMVLFANLMLLGTHPFYQASLLLQGLFYGLAVIGSARRSTRPMSRLVYIPYYFCLVNWASLRGIIENYFGRTYTTWETVRQQ